MTETQTTDLTQAKAELDLARAYHAGAVLAARHRPDDPQAHYRVQAAVQQGRGAWKAYRLAVTNGQVAPIEPTIPSAFQEV